MINIPYLNDRHRMRPKQRQRESRSQAVDTQSENTLKLVENEIANAKEVRCVSYFIHSFNYILARELRRIGIVFAFK